MPFFLRQLAENLCEVRRVLFLEKIRRFAVAPILSRRFTEPTTRSTCRAVAMGNPVTLTSESIEIEPLPIRRLVGIARNNLF